MSFKESPRPIALITGSARRIGAEMARMLAGLGWSLILHYHNSKAEASALCMELNAQGCETWPIKANLLNPADLDQLSERVIELTQYRGLGLVIHNASVFQTCRFEEMGSDILSDNMRLHCEVPLLLSKNLCDVLHKSKRGLIVTILDSGSQKHWKKYFPYCLSKQAMREATISMAKSLAPGIRVNGIALGLILAPQKENTEFEFLEANNISLRSGQPVDACYALEYLLNAEFVNGEILRVDGGQNLK
jgi:pteridine reductase